VLTVDTNFLNWLRASSRSGYSLAAGVVYVPNCSFGDGDAKGMSVVRRDGQPLRVLFVRRWEYKRGGELLLHALQQLASEGVRFTATLAAGGGAAEAQAAIGACGLQDRVAAVNVPLDQVYGLYREHDVAVVPSLWSEGTSFALAEAIRAGLPVIATAVGGLPNLVIDGFNGRVVQPTAPALAAALRELACDGNWLKYHAGALQLGDAIGRERWESAVLDWLMA
jgi:glycosyltransferase involved in cell wall biosynthesis